MSTQIGSGAPAPLQPMDSGSDGAVAAIKPLHVGLLWHTVYNENLGVGALSIANAALVAAAVERAGYRPVLHLIGARGRFDYGHELNHEYDFTNVGMKALFNPLSGLHRTFRQCDIVFDIGGGDSFSDIYSGKRYWMMILSKMAAVAAGAPLVFSPQTIGPFHTTIARRAAVHVLQLADHVFARDELSRAVLDELGFDSKSSLSCDVAFALPFRQPERPAADAGAPLKVGLNVSALLYRLHRSPHSKIRLAADYPTLIRSLMERLAKDPAIELHLVGHVIAANDPADPAEGHYEDDYSLARELQALYPGAIVAPRFASPVEAKSYIAGLDLFAGSRMHATIAAISSGTAVVPLGYSRKFSGLFGSIGYQRNVDLVQEGNDIALQKFEAALADVAAVREEAVAANAEAQRRLQKYTGFLDTAIARVVGRHA